MCVRNQARVGWACTPRHTHDPGWAQCTHAYTFRPGPDPRAASEWHARVANRAGRAGPRETETGDVDNNGRSGPPSSTRRSPVGSLVRAPHHDPRPPGHRRLFYPRHRHIASTMLSCMSQMALPSVARASSSGAFLCGSAWDTSCVSPVSIVLLTPVSTCSASSLPHHSAPRACRIDVRTASARCRCCGLPVRAWDSLEQPEEGRVSGRGRGERAAGLLPGGGQPQL